MNDRPISPAAPEKKPYVKPACIPVELRPEEAVLGACKTASSAGPGAGTCATLVCNALGS